MNDSDYEKEERSSFARDWIGVLVFLGILAFLILKGCGPEARAQHLPKEVGGVDFTKPCSFQFHKRDVSYLPDGSLLIKKATVFNTTKEPDGHLALGAIIGELPPVPKGVPVADTSKNFIPVFDSNNCKPAPYGRAECKRVIFRPTAISAKR